MATFDPKSLRTGLPYWRSALGVRCFWCHLACFLRWSGYEGNDREPEGTPQQCTKKDPHS